MNNLLGLSVSQPKRQLLIPLAGLRRWWPNCLGLLFLEGFDGGRLLDHGQVFELERPGEGKNGGVFPHELPYERPTGSHLIAADFLLITGNVKPFFYSGGLKPRVVFHFYFGLGLGPCLLLSVSLGVFGQLVVSLIVVVVSPFDGVPGSRLLHVFGEHAVPIDARFVPSDLGRALGSQVHLPTHQGLLVLMDVPIKHTLMSVRMLLLVWTPPHQLFLVVEHQR